VATVNHEEKSLALEIKQGNHLAFATIYDKYHKQLYALAYRYLKSREMTEDAVQQIFVNFWVNRLKINENLNIKSLLFTSLKNHTLNVIRDNHKAIEKNYEILVESITDVEGGEGADLLEDSIEMTDQIEKAVATLSPQRRQIFYLKIMEGCSNQQIAEKLGISVNTVKVQYYHVLKEIREYVSKNMLSSLALISCLFR
jgi:RNA polymerase sigma-70 factor (family 1)